MIYKFLSFAIFCLFSFANPQISAPKITGKYGKMDREHGEYICLELFDDKKFSMSISSCDRDRYIDGNYAFDGAAVYLTSTKQPRMNIAKIDSETDEDDTPTLTFSSKDAPLIQQIKVRLNDDKNEQSPNEKGQITATAPIENITIRLGELETAHRFRQPDDNQLIHLNFEHLSDMTMKNQAWAYSKKKLILTDESGTQITLKKSRKCWFDYKFKEE